MIAFLRGIGLERAVGLAGGYKAYRRLVMTALDSWNGPRPVVLHGLTGVGKTLVLRAIERLRPGWTLDLEALAGHRSSMLGMVGLEPCCQKTFDSRLFGALRRRSPGPLIVEGESRKVGNTVLPSGLWGAMGHGEGLWLAAPMETRVKILLDDYLGQRGNREPLRRQLATLARWLPQDIDWLRLFDRGEEPELVRLLLERHYDPLYKHTAGEADCARSFDTQDPESAAREVVAWIESRPASRWSE